MADGQHRVVVWSTGGIGSIAIRAIHQRPDLDLVGVWVHSEDKVGTRRGRTRQRRADRPGHHQRRRRVDRAETRLRRLRGQRPGTRRARRARLRQASQRGHQRGDDEHHPPGQPARLRACRVARPAGGRREGRPGLAVRVGHRTRLRGRLSAARAEHPFLADREDPLLRDRAVRRLRRARHHERRTGIRPSAGLPAVDQLSRRDRRRVAGPDPDGRRGARRRGRGGARDVRPRGDRADAGGRDGHRRSGHLRRAADAGDRCRRRQGGDRHRARHPTGARRRAGLADAAQRARLPRGDHRDTGHRLHIRRDTAGPPQGRDRKHDIRRGRHGRDGDAGGQRGAVCRCGAAGSAQLGRPAADDPARRLH